MDTSILSQLRDIHGLDPLPWWHIAPGWLALPLALLVLALLLSVVLRPRHSWSAEARRELYQLRHGLRDKNPDTKTLLAEFSALLRRVAMARHGRRACAGLHGQDWLEWLQAHDPKGFAWEQHGQILLNAVYAPPGAAPAPEHLRPLLDAAQTWLTPEPRPGLLARLRNRGEAQRV